MNWSYMYVWSLGLPTRTNHQQEGSSPSANLEQRCINCLQIPRSNYTFCKCNSWESLLRIAYFTVCLWVRLFCFFQSLLKQNFFFLDSMAAWCFFVQVGPSWIRKHKFFKCLYWKNLCFLVQGLDPPLWSFLLKGFFFKSCGKQNKVKILKF